MASTEGNRLGTVLLVGVVAVAAAFVVKSSYDWSHDRIAANERARVVARLNSVLDPALRKPRPHDDAASASRTPTLLGSDDPIDVFVLSAARPTDGGAVRERRAARLQRVDRPADRRVAGRRRSPACVRCATAKRRGSATPSMPRRAIGSSNSTGKTLAAPAAALWAVEQDDGEFDSITGATVTSRAVVTAVKNTLLYFEQHRDELYAAAAAAAADADDDEPD